MPSSARRPLAAVAAAVCSLGLLAFAPSASAAMCTPPVPAPNVIVIPGPEVVSNAMDAARCPWMTAYVTALTSTTGSRSMAMLLVAPMVAAEYGTAGE